MFPSLRERGPDYRRQLLDTFGRIIDLAIEQKVSLLLVAGDLFDSNAVLGTPIRTVLSSFKKLGSAGIRTCILPGTHDPYSDDSIYRSMELPSSVTVFTPQRVSVTYADLDLTVYGRAFDGKSCGTNALEGLALSPHSRLHVGMAHGSLRMEGITEREAMFVDGSTISDSGFDYLAIGHWHSFRDCSQGATKAFYCGSPEPINMDQRGSGSVALVTVYDRGRVDVEQIRVGSKVFDEMTINVELGRSLAEITQTISLRADPNLILEATLEGAPSPAYELDPRELEEELRRQFFSLRLVDRTSERFSDVPIGDYPQDTVAGRFVRAMEARLAQSPPDERGIYAEALALGVALIQKGPRVIE